MFKSGVVLSLSRVKLEILKSPVLFKTWEPLAYRHEVSLTSRQECKNLKYCVFCVMSTLTAVDLLTILEICIHVYNLSRYQMSRS